MDKKINKSFVFYEEWYSVLEGERQEVQWEVIHAVMEYVFRDNLVELKPNSKMAFKFIKNDIDRAKENYNSFVEKQRGNGKKGGRPKNPNNPNLLEKPTQSLKDNDNVNENVDDDKDPSLFKLEDCYTVALRDNDWVEASGANGDKLSEFNLFLKGQGIKKKNPADYKQHFYHWWKKSGNQVPGKREGVMSIQPSMAELKAKEFLKNR